MWKLKVSAPYKLEVVYFFKLFSLLKKAFSKIIYSCSEHTSLHFLLYSAERSNMSLILTHGNSLHWLHLLTPCPFVHSTNWYVHFLWEEQPSQAISSFETTHSLQPTLYHSSATAFNSSSLCALYLGHSIQLSPHKVIFSSIITPPISSLFNSIIIPLSVKINVRRKHNVFPVDVSWNYLSCSILEWVGVSLSGSMHLSGLWRSGSG